MKKYASIENVSCRFRVSHQLRIASQDQRLSWRQRLALRVAALSVEKTSLIQMDQIARLQFLEGVAGVNAGSWSRNAPAGMLEASKHFLDPSSLEEFGGIGGLEDQFLEEGDRIRKKDLLELGSTLYDVWLQPYDTGLYRVPRDAADRIMQGSMGMDGDDLMQNLMSGVSYDRQGEPSVRSETVYYRIGKDAAKAGFDPDSDKPSDYTGIASSYASRQALNIKRKEQTEQAGRQRLMDEEAYPLISGERSATALWLDMMTNRSDPYVAAVWDVFIQAWRKSENWPLIQAILRQGLTGGHKSVKEGWKEISKELGVSPDTIRAAEQRAARMAEKALAKEIKANPRGIAARALVRVSEIMDVERSLGLGRLVNIVKKMTPKVEKMKWSDIVVRYKTNPNDRKILQSVWSKMRHWKVIQIILNRMDSQGRPLDVQGQLFRGRGFWTGLAAELGFPSGSNISAIKNQAQAHAIKALQGSQVSEPVRSASEEPPF